MNDTSAVTSLRVRAPQSTRRDGEGNDGTPMDPRGAAMSPAAAWLDAGNAALMITGGRLSQGAPADDERPSPHYSAFVHTHGMPSPSLGPPAVIERVLSSRTPRGPPARPTARQPPLLTSLDDDSGGDVMSALALPPTAIASAGVAAGKRDDAAAADDVDVAVAVNACSRSDGPSSSTAPASVRPVSGPVGAMTILGRNAIVYSLIVACLIGYGGSLFVNGISSALLQSNSVATDTTAKLHAWSSSLLLNSSGRAITLLLVVLPVAWRMRLATTNAPVALTTDTCFPVVITVFGNIGFLAFFGLVDGGGSDVSTLSAMVGLYSVIPVAWAILRRGERATYVKLGGIFLSLAAAVLLGLSPSSSGDSGTTGDAARIVTKAALYLLCTGLWGVNDILSSGMRLDVFTLALSSAVGQVLNAAIFGFIALFTTSACSSPGASRDSLSWPHVLIMCANGAAILSWLAFVFLSRLAPASVYMPIVSLYTSVSVILSLGVLHESVTVWKACGLVLAAIAVVATGWSGADEAPPTDEAMRAASDSSAGRRMCGRLMLPIAHVCEVLSRWTRRSSS